MIFSVVVPTHNRPETLKLLLDSLVAQSLDSSQFEIIIVPSPMDKSLKLLADYAKTCPVRLITHVMVADPYQGKSASYKRNQGAARASSDWIAFIDDDCIADPLWLATAAQHTQKVDLHGMEGATEIPVPIQPTLTYKGIQRLSARDGYQTCNMFYRKKTFLDLGGFDLNFPFYLEDTDLAWTFLDNNKQIMYVEGAIVRHPVPPAEPGRLLDNAKRTRLLPYLYKKHPEQFEHSDLRPLGTSQWAYLFIYAGITYSTLVSDHPLRTLLTLTPLVLIFNAAYIYRLIHDCAFETKELMELFIYLPVAPVIALVQLIRGNIENKTFLLF